MAQPAITTPRAPDKPETLSDLALLRAVEQDRDRHAFDQLFARHQDRCYSLAFHILQNSALAEECVQEAMLALWLTPKMERADRNVQAYILGLVAGKSMNLRRGQKRQSRREAQCARAHFERPVSADLERGETLATVRRQLARLPELDSQLLACCYGAELSHQRISEIFGIPRRTITGRIQQALALLRSHLGVEADALALPLVSAELLQRAFTSGHACPPLRLELPAKLSVRSPRSMRRLPKQTSYSGVLAGTGILAVVIAVAAFSPGQAAPTRPIVAASEPELAAQPVIPKAVPAVVTAAVPATPLVLVPAPSAPTPIHRVWDFAQKPESLDLISVNQNLQWRSGPHGGEVAPNGDKLPVLILPDIVRGQNVRLKVDLDLNALDRSICALCTWLDGRNTAAFEFWVVPTTIPLTSETRHSTTVIFRRGECIQSYDGHLNTYRKYATAEPGDRILVQFSGAAIRAISLDTISDAEADAEFKAAARSIQDFWAQPAKQYLPQALPANVQLK